MHLFRWLLYLYSISFLFDKCFIMETIKYSGSFPRCFLWTDKSTNNSNLLSLYTATLSIPLSSSLRKLMKSLTVCETGLSTNSHDSFRDGKGTENTDNPCLYSTDTSETIQNYVFSVVFLIQKMCTLFFSLPQKFWINRELDLLSFLWLLAI